MPGFWLTGSSWWEVVPVLRRAGHRPQPLTLPGTAQRSDNLAEIGVRDHVAAVVDAIDANAPSRGRLALVAQGFGVAIAHAAVDARPDRASLAVYIGGVPVAPGEAIDDELVVDNEGGIPLPPWSHFGEDKVFDLDDDRRAALRETAVQVPIRVANEPLQLTDDRRYDVPVAMVCCAGDTVEQLHDYLAQGIPYLRELARITDVTWRDLSAGYWPQLTAPERLGRTIVDLLAAHE